MNIKYFDTYIKSAKKYKFLPVIARVERVQYIVLGAYGKGCMYIEIV